MQYTRSLDLLNSVQAVEDISFTRRVVKRKSGRVYAIPARAKIKGSQLDVMYGSRG